MKPNNIRVATNVNDLRAGQTVALGEERGWTIERVTEPSLWSWNFEHDHTVVILTDPPAKPVSVPAKTVDLINDIRRFVGVDNLDDMTRLYGDLGFLVYGLARSMEDDG